MGYATLATVPIFVHLSYWVVMSFDSDGGDGPPRLLVLVALGRRRARLRDLIGAPEGFFTEAAE